MRGCRQSFTADSRSFVAFEVLTIRMDLPVVFHLSGPNVVILCNCLFPRDHVHPYESLPWSQRLSLRFFLSASVRDPYHVCFMPFSELSTKQTCLIHKNTPWRLGMLDLHCVGKLCTRRQGHALFAKFIFVKSTTVAHFFTMSFGYRSLDPLNIPSSLRNYFVTVF